jgi:Zn-dependent oligopeptidase
MVRLKFMICRWKRVSNPSFFLIATVFKADPLDPARGKLYRDKILRAGGSREEIDSLKVNDLCQTFELSS